MADLSVQVLAEVFYVKFRTRSLVFRRINKFVLLSRGLTDYTSRLKHMHVTRFSDVGKRTSLV